MNFYEQEYQLFKPFPPFFSHVKDTSQDNTLRCYFPQLIKQAKIDASNKITLPKMKKLFLKNQQNQSAILNNKEIYKQNSLNKIKNYRRMLDASSKLSKIHSNQNGSNDQTLQSTKLANSLDLTTNIKTQQISQIQKKNTLMKNHVDSQIQDKNIQKVYNYYAMKNQRKLKILQKVKQLGHNNFYRFLKGASVIQTNKHMHRFHTEKIENNNEQDQKERQIQNISSPLISSYEPILPKQSSQQNISKLQLPNLFPNKIRKNLSKRKHIKSQPSFFENQNNLMTEKQKQSTEQHKSLGSLRLINESSLQLLKRQKKRQKTIMRSLTQIKQKKRKIRAQFTDNRLLFNLDPKSTKNTSQQHLYFQKWKYKSIFQSLIQQSTKISTPLLQSPQSRTPPITKKQLKKKLQKLKNSYKAQQLSLMLTQNQSNQENAQIHRKKQRYQKQKSTTKLIVQNKEFIRKIKLLDKCLEK